MDDAGSIVARPIAFEDGETLSLILYGTGLRGRSDLAHAALQIGGLILQADYCGPQMEFPGLDQVNIILPRSFAGAGTVPVKMFVDGVESNTVSLVFQ